MTIIHLIFLLQNELMQHFHKGRRDRFFKEWNDSLHPSVRDGDAVAKKLEFYLNIYFAIFPIKFARGQVIHLKKKSTCNILLLRIQCNNCVCKILYIHDNRYLNSYFHSQCLLVIMGNI